MKLWGGRFAKQTDELVRQFNDSISFDIRMAAQDIAGSIAWANGLVGAGVLAADEATTIIKGLKQVEKEIESGAFEIAAGDEDIHTAVERRLTEIVGPLGGKLHTGRSRNDQAVTDFRLWIRDAVVELDEALAELQKALLASAVGKHDLVMPGYTHLQHAQPISWGHWILSHFWPLVRDRRRLQFVTEMVDELALGCAAMAGTAYPVDRQALADALQVSNILHNSIDAVSNRDYVADFLYACAMIGLHLSRLSEQLILFSTAEFAFVRLDDAYSTGSSIMPQKKNPDTLELTRGKSGRLLGNAVGLLATLKGLPSSYDKDLQEDKEPVFDSFDTLMLTLPVMTGVIETLTLRPEKMAAQLDPLLLATDLADYLVKKGMPFRQAHHVVGAIVQLAEVRDMRLDELEMDAFQEISDVFEEDALDIFNMAKSLERRNAQGGTSKQAFDAQIAAAQAAIG